MKGLPEKYRSFFLILSVFLCQLLVIDCSRRIYTESSFVNIESRSERKRLNDFMAGGVGKVVNTRNTNTDEIIKTAQQYLGVPHCMGGKTMKCMDCSGLLVAVFAKYDIRLPHNSEEQARYGKIVPSMDKLQKGDLVFFIRSYRTSNFITHSGIYIGNSRFIHTSTSNGVTITALSDPWWNEKFIFGTRLLE